MAICAYWAYNGAFMRFTMRLFMRLYYRKRVKWAPCNCPKNETVLQQNTVLIIFRPPTLLKPYWYSTHNGIRKNGRLKVLS